MYFPSFGMIRKPKSEEFQFNKKVLHIMSSFCNSVNTKLKVKNHLKFRSNGKGKYLKVIFPIHCINHLKRYNRLNSFLPNFEVKDLENPPKCDPVTMELPF